MKFVLLLLVLVGCADPKTFEGNTVNNVYVAPEPGEEVPVVSEPVDDVTPPVIIDEDSKSEPECNEGQSNVSKKDCDGDKDKKEEKKEKKEDKHKGKDK